MSKNNNVNPGQYKVAGRERPGEDVVQRDHKARLTQAPPVKATTPQKAVTSKTGRRPAR